MSKLNEMDFKVVMDMSGLSISEDISDNLVDKSSIKKEIIEGIPRFTVNMTGTTLGKQSINGLTMVKPETDNMLSKEVVATRLKNDALHCEMNHPFSNDVKRLRAIDQNNISHRLRKFFYSPGNTALCVTLTTSQQQAGRNLAYFLEDGSNIALSMRAHAAATRINGEIMKDINFTSYDAVWFASNRESWSSQSAGILESIDTDLALAFGTTADSLMNFKLKSLEHLDSINNKSIKRMQLLESYLWKGRGATIVDLGNQDISESIMNIAESSGIKEMSEVTHLIISESADTVIFASGNLSAEAKVAKNLYNDIISSCKSKLYSFKK